ncbi:hypothetical protein CEXT_597431 [Caerostris extrusa]|uniref:Uncharacterized protein n=1 Tax=Caerostris extrusa TaxID=172846 RepID=A0AAV4WHF3_CAEEX|nr:hypothetical protein CEXT_597431 [Caerostris extrusa]
MAEADFLFIAQTTKSKSNNAGRSRKIKIEPLSVLASLQRSLSPWPRLELFCSIRYSEWEEYFLHQRDKAILFCSAIPPLLLPRTVLSTQQGLVFWNEVQQLSSIILTLKAMCNQ